MFPTSEQRVAEEEERLGRRLPDELRNRLLEENGGEIEVVGDFASPEQSDNIWQLVGVTDVVERKGRPRPVTGMAQYTEEQREYMEDPPEDAVAIAYDSSGNDLLLMPDDSYRVYWHEDGELSPATVHWRVRDL